MKTLLIFRRSLFLILFITAYILGYTQNPSDGAIYLEENDILYRNGEITEYMRERCRLDVYYPKDEEGFSTVIWFHGGGLRAGNKSIPGSLKKQGFAVVPVNYRLFPKVKSPAYIDDAAAAVAWVFNHIEKYGGDVKRIFISGHSAGGYLTSMIGLDKSY
ncbi:MAG: alpha/beta hydrolase, partial [Cyclobacteriaceae bacterium]|nr:alpha/beta hydrolase [Cyclobacteriaceae bacterium]